MSLSFTLALMSANMSANTLSVDPRSAMIIRAVLPPPPPSPNYNIYSNEYFVSFKSVSQSVNDNIS
jgi:hypothetical protein